MRGSTNANSIVLGVNYRGQRILLTGDLAPPGLEEVLEEEPSHYNVVLAPHHGSVTVDPRGLLAWSTPQWVEISGRPCAEFSENNVHLRLQRQFAPSHRGMRGGHGVDHR